MTKNVDWINWLERWDIQQRGYLPDREGRFNAMLDVLDVLLDGEFVALDLACGPGSISQRLLARFPHARCVAVDFDPVLLHIGQGALENLNGRLRWVEADLCQSDWVEKLGETHFDAVLSTTALHWLSPESLITVYKQLGKLVKPGGVVLNGDNIDFALHMSTFQNIAETVKKRRQKEAFEQQGIEDWEKWWGALKKEPALETLVAEREHRFGSRNVTWKKPIYEMHEAALRDAGFREVGIIWQNMDNRVVMAIR
jgi:SAM-dependent methyltransferase